MKPLYSILTLAAGAALAGCAGSEDMIVASALPKPAEQKNTVASSGHDALNERISHYAQKYNIPESLIHTSVQRESRYNPGAKNGPYWGLMQIRHDTAKSMGYSGPATGLLDADTNLKYASAYLANAYLIAGGNERRAIQLYANGYYFEAKRKGLLNDLRTASAE